ncbi:nuclear transport factor 2 family protein [Chromobacterium haemolyticum]|uniref:nuclear transport factor 2 family protein n=1 Tax=Chromobacterium haemolyticum TaxID=394935 RepID=UPI001962EF5A|nr:hypothetical protein [Chromobacterium haemolyticum]
MNANQTPGQGHLSNVDIVRATYEGDSEANGRNLLAALAPDAEWTEAAGFPYAGTYVGAESIVKNVHERLGREWEGYRAAVDSFYDAGEHVIAQGFYHASTAPPAKALSPLSPTSTRCGTARSSSSCRLWTAPRCWKRCGPENLFTICCASAIRR